MNCLKSKNKKQVKGLLNLLRSIYPGDAGTVSATHAHVLLVQVNLDVELPSDVE